MPVLVSMVDPQGRECFAGSPTEINDLLALGYTLKGHTEPLRTGPGGPEEIDDLADRGLRLDQEVPDGQ